MTMPEADLTGWTAEPFTAAGFTYDVYRKGEGPGVVLIPEMPGIHPGVLALGNHLVDNGFTVAAPSLFGTPGAPAIRPGMVPVLLRGCVAREFAAFATNADRPVAHYLRALARDLNEKTPGKGVGVIGQCFTGGFALAAAVDESVLAPGAEPAVAAVAADAQAATRSRALRSRVEDRRTTRRQ
jgi:dienelactone hydrolase